MSRRDNKQLWKRLLGEIPGLAQLHWQASTADRGGQRFCKWETWERPGPAGIKQDMKRIVGHFAPAHPDELVNTHTAYDAAYDTLLHAIPPCRNCCHDGADW